MPRELKPGSVPIPSNIPLTNEIEAKESAPIPSTLKEFQEATTNALDFGDKHLGLWSADGTELSTIAFEEWTDITMDLDEMFFELRDGILGKQLLTFASLADAELINPHIRSEIESLLAQTAPLAKRMNPLIDRLCAVNPTMSRSDIIATLREGELNATETLDYIAKQPVRRSLLGIFHDLEERLKNIAATTPSNSPLAGGGPDGTSTLWDFKNTSIIDLTPVVILSDPFSNDAESQKFWADRADEPILKRSQQKTQSIIYELESLRQTMEGNGEKACPSKPCEDGKKVMDALDVIESWLESNMILYRDGKEVDFELYHLGMEEPQEVDAIFGSLDIIKHDNPEFFVQLMGINPTGGKSPYFGSFIHKALFNTQKTLDGIVTEAPNLVLKSSMKQLLRIDGTVQRWNFHETISEESIKEIARRMERRIAVEPTESGKNQIRMLWATMLTKPTIELAVKRQLEAMKEVNFKQIKAELLAKLDDIEHPMLALKAISTLPLIAFRDAEIKNRLTAIFGVKAMEDPGDLRERCGKGERMVVKAMFDRIPVFDYEMARVGKFFSIVTQEAMAREKKKGIIKRISGSEDFETDGKMFLYEMLQGRVMTPALVKAGLSNAAQLKFFTAMDNKYRVAEIMGGSIMGKDTNPDIIASFSRGEYSPSCDRPLLDALTHHWEWTKRTMRRTNTRREELAEDELDLERDTCIAFVTLGQGSRANDLMKDFEMFTLRKKDAAKVAKVIFEHLGDVVTSYKQFEFLLKYAEKFEEGDLAELLDSLNKDHSLLFMDIIRYSKESYPPVFQRYLRDINSREIGYPFDAMLIALLEEGPHEATGATSRWDEKYVLNFARTPQFADVFTRNAKRVFEYYPDLPVKLYGEWGAKAIKMFNILKMSPEILREWPNFCPKNANDDIREKWKMLQKKQYIIGGDLCLRILWDFEREFPEVTSESYREMREVFGELLLGFTEVEQAFTNKSGKQWMTIGDEERRNAIEQLNKKLQEPETARFIKNAKENPNREKSIALIYRVDIGARGEEEQERIMSSLVVKHFTPGWHFIPIHSFPINEQDERGIDDRAYDDFVLNRNESLREENSARGRFFEV